MYVWYILLNIYLHLYRVIVPEKQTDKAPLLIIPNCTYIEQIFVKEKLKTILWLTVQCTFENDPFAMAVETAEILITNAIGVTLARPYYQTICFYTYWR